MGVLFSAAERGLFLQVVHRLCVKMWQHLLEQNHMACGGFRVGK